VFVILASFKINYIQTCIKAYSCHALIHALLSNSSLHVSDNEAYSTARTCAPSDQSSAITAPPAARYATRIRQSLFVPTTRKKPIRSCRRLSSKARCRYAALPRYGFSLRAVSTDPGTARLAFLQAKYEPTVGACIGNNGSRRSNNKLLSVSKKYKLAATSPPTPVPGNASAAGAEADFLMPRSKPLV
jgi:hypothetical protein